jgi:hypothetical protein
MTTQSIPSVVAGEQVLADFRQGLTGECALRLLREAGGRLLVQLAVGVGKSEWMLQIIVHALTTACVHDLVVVLVPRRDILRELLQRLPGDLHYVVLRPRPRSRCGDLDADWLEYEQNGCALLGREQLCKICPRRRGCLWPRQYGKRLRGVRLIFATQQHLVLNPQFVHQLCQHTRAEQTLVLLDESDLLLRSAERTIGREHLERFIAAQQRVLSSTANARRSAREWLQMSELLAAASTSDLQEGHWRFPFVHASWAIVVQRTGRDAEGNGFRFLGFDLHHFGHSDPWSRERLGAGDLRFAVSPYLGREFIVFSGSIAKDLARYRLDPNHRRLPLVSPFECCRFEHPQTRWFNLSSTLGAAEFFPRNAPAILDFFAEKIAQNIRKGKRTLLVARKKFRRSCKTYLTQRLRELGIGRVQIVTGRWDRMVFDDARTVPLINYGVSGLNCFQHFDAAYCLTSYYVNAATVAQTVHDIDACGERYPIRVECVGEPPQRCARIDLPDNRETILPRIVQGVLEQKEADVVVQAVGRVRPFTQPREVITFQRGSLPGVRYTMQFRSLSQARSFFGIKSNFQARLEIQVAHARRLKVEGYSKSQIAAKLGVSLSTVKRYLRRGGGQKSISNYREYF